MTDFMSFTELLNKFGVAYITRNSANFTTVIFYSSPKDGNLEVNFKFFTETEEFVGCGHAQQPFKMGE